MSGRGTPVAELHSYTYVFGPTFSFRRQHAAIFAHALFAENTISDSVVTGFCVVSFNLDAGLAFS
ncbi:MAG: hypothetical protein WA188_00710 [Terriglobales bacterium]